MPIAESLTVALPAYNEEANIAAMVDEVVADLLVGYRSPRRDPLPRRINGWAFGLRS